MHGKRRKVINLGNFKCWRFDIYLRKRKNDLKTILTYPLTESALLGLAGLSGCWDRPELDPSRDLALFAGGPSLWRPCETVLIILRTEYLKSNSPRFSIENTRVFLVLMSMAPKLMSLTGETAYLL